MNLKQGVAVALIQSVVTILIAGVIFAHALGQIEQKLDDLALSVEGHGERILYLERK